MFSSKLKKYLLLSAIATLFLYQIINIPFVVKPAYAKTIASNPNIADFLNLKFVLIALLVTFLSIILFNFRKEFILKYRSWFVFGVAFLYTSFRILKTFDVTDTGYHFTKAWGLLHGSVKENVDFMVGTNLLNGLWLSLIGEPSVLWARFGFVLVVSFTVLFSYKIYNLYFKELHHLIIFTSLIFFFVHFNYYLSVNYDNLPLLSTLIASWFILKNQEFKCYNYLLAGIFFGLAIWLKFNYILILSLPVIYGFYLYVITDSKYLKKSLTLCGGYLIAILSGVIILTASGSFGDYTAFISDKVINKKSTTPEQDEIKEQILNFGQKSVKSQSKIINSSDKFYFLNDSLKNDSLRKDEYYTTEVDPHSFKGLFNTYFVDFATSLNYTVQYFFLFSLLILLFSYKVKSIIIKTIFSGIMVFYLYYTAYISLMGRDHVFISSLLVCGLVYFILTVEKESKYYQPIMLSLLLALFSFPGSNLSFNVIYRSGAGLLFMALPLAYLYDKTKTIGTLKLDFKYYTIIMVGFVVLATVKSWGYNDSHRDLNDRSLLITMFKSDQLFGIHSMPQRVQVVDELLDFFNKEKYVKNGTPALFMDWLPMFYYLTETNCIMNNPWHSCTMFSVFKAEFEAASKTKPPVYIVFSSKFTRNPVWPLNDENYRKSDKAWLADLKQDDYIKYWMKDKNYQKVFINDMFEVWKKQK